MTDLSPARRFHFSSLFLSTLAFFAASCLASAAPTRTLSAPPAAPSSSATPEEVVAAHDFFLKAREADRAGDAAGALAWYGLAFRHDAQSRDLCFFYLERLKDAGAVDEARATAAACKKLAGDSTAGAPRRNRPPLTLAEHKVLGEVALRAEDIPAALTHYRAVLALDEDDGDALYVLAGLYEDAGDWEGHAEVVRRLLPRLNYPVRLMERLARTYARLDRSQDFIPVLAQAWDRTRAPVFGRTLAAHYEAAGLNLSLLTTARSLAESEPGPEQDALLARAYLVADRPDSALALTRTLLARTPGDEALRFLHASLLFERGRYKEARPHAGALVKTSPGTAAYHVLEGSILLELRARAGTVRAALDKALALAPLSPETRARRAYAEYALQASGSRAAAPGSAVADMLAIPLEALSVAEGVEASRELPEGQAAVLEERRLLLEGLAHGRLAQELATRAPGQRPARLTDTALERRHRREALARYETILARNSGQRAALFEAGVQYERLGELERAKPLFRRLVVRDTTHATAMNYLAYSLLEQDSLGTDEKEESLALLGRALALDPENGAFRDSKGWWHYRAGEYDSAVTWLEAAHEAVPGDPAILDHLVQAYHAAGRRDEACAALRRLEVIHPRHGLTLQCPVAKVGKGAAR